MTTKVKLTDRLNQMIILGSAELYMMADVIQVYEDNKGKQMGKLRASLAPVLFDKESRVWREVN